MALKLAHPPFNIIKPWGACGECATPSVTHTWKRWFSLDGSEADNFRICPNVLECARMCPNVPRMCLRMCYLLVVWSCCDADLAYARNLIGGGLKRPPGNSQETPPGGAQEAKNDTGGGEPQDAPKRCNIWSSCCTILG